MVLHSIEGTLLHDIDIRCKLSKLYTAFNIITGKVDEIRSFMRLVITKSKFLAVNLRLQQSHR